MNLINKIPSHLSQPVNPVAAKRIKELQASLIMTDGRLGRTQTTKERIENNPGGKSSNSSTGLGARLLFGKGRLTPPSTSIYGKRIRSDLEFKKQWLNIKEVILKDRVRKIKTSLIRMKTQKRVATPTTSSLTVSNPQLSGKGGSIKGGSIKVGSIVDLKA